MRNRADDRNLNTAQKPSDEVGILAREGLTLLDHRCKVRGAVHATVLALPPGGFHCIAGRVAKRRRRHFNSRALGGLVTISCSDANASVTHSLRIRAVKSRGSSDATRLFANHSAISR
jgi:hypothetical protein